MTTATQPQQIAKIVMNFEQLTEEQIRNENREYNARAWDEKIDRMAKYKNCKFYVARPQRGFDYPRYYAVYEIPEGIILLNEVSYSSCLSSNGFCRVIIGSDGTVSRHLLKDLSGNFGYCENNKDNRRIMAANSQKFGVIFTNNF